MSGATAAASASQQAAPTAAEARSELEEALWGRIDLEQIVKILGYGILDLILIKTRKFLMLCLENQVVIIS